MQPPPPGALSVQVTTFRPNRRRPRRTHDEVVVYLENAPGELPDTTNVVHEIRQIDQEFVPRVSVVGVGTTLSFPNDDRIFHNVWSASKAGRFDLGLYKSGTTKTHVSKREGVIEVFCNIHPHMEAKILIVDTPHYAMTDAQGRTRLGGVPPGTYRWVAWQAWGEHKKGKVTIPSGGTAELALELETERPPRRHARKDGSAYPRNY